MNKFTSIFSQLLRLFPRIDFEKAVKETKAELKLCFEGNKLFYFVIPALRVVDLSGILLRTKKDSGQAGMTDKKLKTKKRLLQQRVSFNNDMTVS